jgi:hypothetical protein
MSKKFHISSGKLFNGFYCTARKKWSFALAQTCGMAGSARLSGEGKRKFRHCAGATYAFFLLV